MGQLGDRLVSASWTPATPRSPRSGGGRLLPSVVPATNISPNVRGSTKRKLAALGERDHDVGVLGPFACGFLARSSWPACRGARRARRAVELQHQVLAQRLIPLMERPSRRPRNCFALAWRRTDRPLATDTSFTLRPTTSLARSWRKPVVAAGPTGDCGRVQMDAMNDKIGLVYDDEAAVRFAAHATGLAESACAASVDRLAVALAVGVVH